MHTKLDLLADKGYCVLRDHDGPPINEREWLDLDYMDWKSGGDTNFAPIASAMGEMECAGFWDHGKPDKDGIWTKNREICPTLVRWVENVGARFGRVRVIKLNPYPDEAAVIRQLHLDDNNRLNPDGEGWVVRSWLELTDCPNSAMVLREDKDDASTESRIPLPRGRQIVIDTERLWHVVSHLGPEPRYALITSFESGPVLRRWMESQLPAREGAAAR
ncbi:MAG TPA: hypothetical protein VG266_09395 [Candidatus Dormibacteraeota bacterium]|jgi:hypothetical protein|nr:hypothetical protein [Candidatus Dormibacteraeota bacterium]